MTTLELINEMKTRKSRKTIRMVSYIGSNEYIFWVMSEPGDSTRYTYLVVWQYQYFSFVNFSEGNNKYPHRVDRYLDTNISLEEAERKYGCNAYTLVECLRTIEELVALKNTDKSIFCGKEKMEILFNKNETEE